MSLISKLRAAATPVLLCLVLAACGKSVEGTYKVSAVSGSAPNATVTLGKNSFAFSEGASGTYEVSGDRVVFSGLTFSGVMKIEGDQLINEKWRFTKEK